MQAVTLANSIFSLFQDPTASPVVYSGKLILLLNMIIMKDANVKETAIKKLLKNSSMYPLHCMLNI